MMKRIMACLIAVACLMTAFATFALAETMTMKVIKCKQAVNLRQGPTTDTPSLGLVPLGTELAGCTPAEGADKDGYKWYAVNYQGAAGYIREDFLEVVAVEEAAPVAEAPAAEEPAAEAPAEEPAAEAPAEEPAPEAPAEEPAPEAPAEEPAAEAPAEEPAAEAPAEEPAAEAPAEEPAAAEEGSDASDEVEGEGVYVPWIDRGITVEAPVTGLTDESQYSDDYVILEADVEGAHIVARQVFTENFEYLLVVAIDAEGNELWRRETATDDVSEMTQTDAFMAGTAEMPLVLIYNDWQGLSAQDPLTGETRWEIRKDQVFLGGSISRVVTPAGIVYIAGYYGPDPVAIDADGNVLWQASSGEYGGSWMYNMELRDVGIACYYAMMNDEHSGAIVYDFNGQIADVQYD